MITPSWVSVPCGWRRRTRWWGWPRPATLVLLLQPQGTDTHSGAAQGPQVGLGEPDGHPLIEKEEKITAAIRASELEEGAERYLVMVTRKGTIKRTPISAYKNIRKLHRDQILDVHLPGDRLDIGAALVAVLVPDGTHLLVIMLCLVNGIPRILTLKEMLEEYLKFQFQVVTRRTQFDLKKAKDREHILEGLKMVCDNTDEVINIIRFHSKDRAAVLEFGVAVQLVQNHLGVGVLFQFDDDAHPVPVRFVPQVGLKMVCDNTDEVINIIRFHSKDRADSKLNLIKRFGISTPTLSWSLV